MPSASAAWATFAPMAPRPITPSVLPMISPPANCFLAFSADLPTFSSSALARTHSTPPMMSREASSMPASTSSFTALALAPGVLNTAMPASANLSSGMLFTPAPARATALHFAGMSMTCISAERTRMASASSTLSVSSYSSVSRARPSVEMLFRQWILYMERSFSYFAEPRFKYRP